MLGQAVCHHDTGAVAVRYQEEKKKEMPKDYHYDKSDYSVLELMIPKTALLHMVLNFPSATPH